ncbi:toprim domain-containing protein [Elizabethkingia ursingii]|uniref:toprim domain-containing protein n=1 Tax=Elizabethkingia ursingii TaxID=1756150 RepID=UPI0020125508|nr:toprim domain-containing protein [Elizabethkingia ursingii]MCL1669549.1 toprim domain-containing protein [Elizabethkingia ursingii]
MNCKQFNSIPLEEVLVSLGHLPTKQNEKEAWYLNPFAKESQASFKLSKSLNLWFLFSEGIGGNNINFMKKYLKASVSEVLDWASRQNFSSFQYQKESFPLKQKSFKPEYEINEITELENSRLKSYLHKRGLSSRVYPYVKEVKFTLNNKRLYAIGFENISGGVELRNSFYKGSLLKKDISVIHMNTDNNSFQKEENKNVAVFEGFMDALSFIEMKINFSGDIIVMNSASLVGKVVEHLKNYAIKALFLDNDPTGEKCKTEILKFYPEAIDCSGIYSAHKDLNDYLVHMAKTGKNTQVQLLPIEIEEQRVEGEKPDKQEQGNKPSFKRRI